MSSKTWKRAREERKKRTQELAAARRPTRAPFLIRLVGLVLPGVKARWFEYALRVHAYKVKHAAKKALHADLARGRARG